MKKILLHTIAVVIIASGLSACGLFKAREPDIPEYRLPEVVEGSPEDVTLRFLNGFVEMDQEALKSYVTNPGNFALSSEENMSDWERLFMKVGGDYFGRMELRLGDTVTDSDAATVDMTFIVPDLSGVISDMTAELVKQTAAAALKGQKLDMEQFAYSYMESKVDMEKLKLTQTSAPVILANKNGEWLIDTDSDANEPMLDAMTGGLLGQIERLPIFD